MRRKIAKRKRKDIYSMKGAILEECWIRKKDWKRKDCGYSVTVHYKGRTVDCGGHDELDAYKLALESMFEIDNGKL